MLKKAVFSLPQVAENPALVALRNASSVLLLQGPVGPLFDRLAVSLQSRGQRVNRVVFSGGDLHDCKALKPIHYPYPLQQWRGFFAAQCKAYNVDCIVLFGQSRAYHEVAITAAAALGIACVVMEEGYFRPGFMTMELGGVNGNSKTLDAAEIAPDSAGLQPLPNKHPFLRAIYFAGIHYGAMLLGHWRFRHYQHHRERSPLYYLAYWHYSWLRKHLAKRKDARTQRDLFASKALYYFVPLQFEGDAQLRNFSSHSSIFEFLNVVMQSFASHAPKGSLLVFKEHPHGRGAGGYHQFLMQAAQALGIAKRIVYFVEGDAPALVQHSAGVVTVNSTVGLRAFQYGVPIYVAGTAVYKRNGLHFGGALDMFWKSAKPVPQALADNFLLQLRNLTQLPTCTYAGRSTPLNLEHGS